MHRRTVLQLLGTTGVIGLGGCLGSTLGQQQPDLPPRVKYTVAITDRGTTPESANLDFDVETREATITTEHTARLAITLTNTGDPRSFWFGDYPPFTETRNTTTDPGLLLLPAGEKYQRISQECWQPAADQVAGYDAIAERVTLDTDEQIEHVTEVWAEPGTESGTNCLSPGPYRFEHEYRTGSHDIPEFTWGFTVNITSHD